MITMQPGTPASAFSKEFPALTDAINQSICCVKKTAAVVFEYAKKVTALALTLFLAGVFPGSFIIGTGIGLLIGVIAGPERLKESLDTISKIWKNQSWLAIAPMTCLAILGFPYTTYIASAVRGAYLGMYEALKAKGY